MNQQFYEQSEVFAENREGRREKLFPRRQRNERRNKSSKWRKLIVALLILGAIATGLTFWGLWGPQTVAALPEQTVNVSGHTTLVVDDAMGDVTIHSGNTNSIVVHATRKVRGLGSSVDDLKVDYKQQGDTVYLTSENGWGINGSRSVDMDITVPRTTDLNINDDSGSVTVEHIDGKLEANTGSGGVDIENSHGEMVISTGSGGIVLQQSQLMGQSSLKTGSGGIDFSGTLDPQGTYHMDALSGGIRLALPANASFHLDTGSVSGDIVNDFGSTVAGSAPQPLLSLHTLSGDIAIHKQ